MGRKPPGRPVTLCRPMGAAPVRPKIWLRPTRMKPTMADTLITVSQYSTVPKLCTARVFTQTTMPALPSAHIHTGVPGNHHRI
ncbi:hypothetical protein D3C80_1996120 [compost metagenome]